MEAAEKEAIPPHAPAQDQVSSPLPILPSFSCSLLCLPIFHFPPPLFFFLFLSSLVFFHPLFLPFSSWPQSQTEIAQSNRWNYRRPWKATAPREAIERGGRKRNGQRQEQEAEGSNFLPTYPSLSFPFLPFPSLSFSCTCNKTQFNPAFSYLSQHQCQWKHQHPHCHRHRPRSAHFNKFSSFFFYFIILF